MSCGSSEMRGRRSSGTPRSRELGVPCARAEVEEAGARRDREARHGLDAEQLRVQIVAEGDETARTRGKLRLGLASHASFAARTRGGSAPRYGRAPRSSGTPGGATPPSPPHGCRASRGSASGPAGRVERDQAVREARARRRRPPRRVRRTTFRTSSTSRRGRGRRSVLRRSSRGSPRCPKRWRAPRTSRRSRASTDDTARIYPVWSWQSSSPPTSARRSPETCSSTGCPSAWSGATASRSPARTAPADDAAGILAGETEKHGRRARVREGHARRAARPAPAGRAGHHAARVRLSGARDLVRLEEELTELEQAMAPRVHDQATMNRYSAAQARLEHAGATAGATTRPPRARPRFADEQLDRPLRTSPWGADTRIAGARARRDPDLLLSTSRRTTWMSRASRRRA